MFQIRIAMVWFKESINVDILDSHFHCISAMLVQRLQDNAIYQILLRED